jgi:hypothetical protein
MSRQPTVSPADLGRAGRTDLTQILGDLDDVKIVEILALRPTVSELEQAAIWAAGEGDILARKGHQLVGVVAEIVDIVTAGEEDEELPRVANS